MVSSSSQALGLLLLNLLLTRTFAQDGDVRCHLNNVDGTDIWHYADGKCYTVVDDGRNYDSALTNCNDYEIADCAAGLLTLDDVVDVLAKESPTGSDLWRMDLKYDGAGASGAGYYDSDGNLADWNGPFNAGLSESSTTPNNHVGDGHGCAVSSAGVIVCNVNNDDDFEFSVCVSCAELDPQLRMWGDWNDWSSPCTCGMCVRTRDRDCVGNYNECMGPDTETSVAEIGPCGIWDDWSLWSDSSCAAIANDCGEGVEMISRTCSGGDDCTGADTITRICDAGPCDNWSDWEDWCPCSVTCGGGMRGRTRTCDGDGLCDGENKEDQACNNKLCPFYDDWQDWGAWSGDCGESSKRVRVRDCLGGDIGIHTECINLGHYLEVEESTVSCDTVPLDWSDWGDCSKTCGPDGLRSKTRLCTTPLSTDAGFECVDVDASMTEPCIDGVDGFYTLCPAWSSWGLWGDCSVDCDEGYHTRSRTCDSGANVDIDSDLCFGSKEEVGHCIEESCTGSHNDDGLLVNTTLHDCDDYMIEKMGYCDAESGACENILLEYVVHTGDTDECYSWNTWSSWGSCSASCFTNHKNYDGDIEVPTQEKTRTCSHDGSTVSQPGDLSIKHCPGNSTIHQTCNAGIACPTWGDWSSGQTLCDAEPCGTGRSVTIKRTCSGADGDCPGASTATYNCEDAVCYIWLQWGDWSSCDCGFNQTSSRTRDCRNSTVPDGNFTMCEPHLNGPGAETRYCSFSPCGIWSSWEESSCTPVTSKVNPVTNRPCGAATKFLSRTCEKDGVPIDLSCEGVANKTEQCDLGPCADFNPWGAWGDCSLTCSDGQRIAIRECLGDGECPGIDTKSENCNDFPACPAWGAWGDWSSCSDDCGIGVQGRSRSCDGSDDDSDCPGPSKEAISCNTWPCASYYEWSDWTYSATCGTVDKARSRECDGDEFECETETMLETETGIDMGPCPAYSDWTDWSPSPCPSCGPGMQSRSRTCEGDDDGTKPCAGPSEEERYCPPTVACGAWNAWDDWSSCLPGPCGSGSKSRTRTCDQDVCDGADEEDSYCYLGPCGVWGTWDDWTDCSLSCGSNSYRDRNRVCSDGNVDCEGFSSEAELCVIDECATTTASPSTSALVTSWLPCPLNEAGQTGWVRVTWNTCIKLVSDRKLKFSLAHEACEDMAANGCVPQLADVQLLQDIEDHAMAEFEVGSYWYRVGARMFSGVYKDGSLSIITTPDYPGFPASISNGRCILVKGFSGTLEFGSTLGKYGKRFICSAECTGP